MRSRLQRALPATGRRWSCQPSISAWPPLSGRGCRRARLAFSMWSYCSMTCSVRLVLARSESTSLGISPGGRSKRSKLFQIVILRLLAVINAFLSKRFNSEPGERCRRIGGPLAPATGSARLGDERLVDSPESIKASSPTKCQNAAHEGPLHGASGRQLGGVPDCGLCSEAHQPEFLRADEDRHRR